MNQEGQALDGQGNFHVLNRENGSYFHYWRDFRTGQWARKRLPLAAVEFGCRGQVCARGGDVYLLLPENDSDKFTILRSNYESQFQNWNQIHREEGYDGEPMYDRYRKDGFLSILQRRLCGNKYFIGHLDVKW
jgi:hypothetical protein